MQSWHRDLVLENYPEAVVRDCRSEAWDWRGCSGHAGSNCAWYAAVRESQKEEIMDPSAKACGLISRPMISTSCVRRLSKMHDRKEVWPTSNPFLWIDHGRKWCPSTGSGTQKAVPKITELIKRISVNLQPWASYTSLKRPKHWSLKCLRLKGIDEVTVILLDQTFQPTLLFLDQFIIGKENRKYFPMPALLKGARYNIGSVCPIWAPEPLK